MEHAQAAPLAQSETALIDRLIQLALEEDIGETGDVTSRALIPPDATAEATFMAREPLVICGLAIASKVFHVLSSSLEIRTYDEEGATVPAGHRLMHISGSAQAILTAERVALNLLQRMCSVATLTRRYVDAVAGTGATILDTRKTMPGLRLLDKMATKAGGAHNHRMGLYDRILIKDNHIAVLGTVSAAIAKAKENRPAGLHIQVECDTLSQVVEAFEAGADSLLLDNMDVHQLRQAVDLCKGKLPLEASGNVTLETVKSIAETGVDYISVGRITHSAPCVDIGLDMEIAHRR